MIVSHSLPISASNTSQDPTAVGDHLDEIVTEFDRVDVLEDLVSAEALSKPVIQPTRGVGRFRPVGS